MYVDLMHNCDQKASKKFHSFQNHVKIRETDAMMNDTNAINSTLAYETDHKFTMDKVQVQLIFQIIKLIQRLARHARLLS